MWGPVGEVNEGQEVGDHAQHEPEDHDRVPPALHGQVTEDAEERAAEHLADGDEHPGDSGQGLGLGAEGRSEANTGSVDSGPDVKLDTSVEERDAQQQHVLGGAQGTQSIKLSITYKTSSHAHTFT